MKQGTKKLTFFHTILPVMAPRMRELTSSRIRQSNREDEVNERYKTKAIFHGT
jgi:hypothetical protein